MTQKQNRLILLVKKTKNKMYKILKFSNMIMSYNCNAVSANTVRNVKNCEKRA